MLVFQWILILLAGSVALSAIARRIGAPYPALLALGGAALALSPVGPDLNVPPELALALFVAPVLLDAAYDASPRDLRDNMVPVAGLVLVSVLLTTITVAMVAHALVPGLPWAAAVTLGAIVAPPDAAAATAVLRHVRPPHRIMVILQGESMLNDASALLIYKVAAGVAVGAALSFGQVLPTLALTLGGSVVVGWSLARLVSTVIRRVEDISSSIILQFVTTFGVWLLADRIGMSGVLTIVIYALTMARLAPGRTSARVRLPSYAVWETMVSVLNTLAFALIGLHVRPILEHLAAADWHRDLLAAAAVLATVIAVRAAWVMSYNTAVRLKNHWFGVSLARPMMTPTFRGGLVVSWCGMRGIVTLAAALALPGGEGGGTAFPSRDLIELCAFAVVLGTLLIQGLSLKPVLRWADLGDDAPVEREIRLARVALAESALSELRGESGREAEMLRGELRAVVEAASSQDGTSDRVPHPLALLRRRIMAPQRDRLLALRRDGVIGDDAFHEVEGELDRQEMAVPPATS